MCEFADFYHETTLRARKPHRCTICGWDIIRGERYARTVAKVDDIYTFCTHLDCAGAGPAFCAATGADCFDHEGVYLLSEGAWLGRHPITGEWAGLEEVKVEGPVYPSQLRGKYATREATR